MDTLLRTPAIRAVVVWLLLALVEVVHGTLRAIFLAPRIGDLPSRQVGVVVGSVLILGIAWLTSAWIGARSRRSLAAIGVLWLVLMLTFEITLGRALGLSWERIASDYVPSRGGYMAIGMAVLAAAPWIAARLRGAVLDQPRISSTSS